MHAAVSRFAIWIASHTFDPERNHALLQLLLAAFEAGDSAEGGSPRMSAMRSGDLFSNKSWLAVQKKNLQRSVKGVQNVYTQHTPYLGTILESILKSTLSRGLKGPSTLSDDCAPSARLGPPRAQPAPTDPRALPQLLGSSPWPR